MSRRTIFWPVVALAGTILLAVVGAIVFSLVDKNGALGLITDLEDEVAAYLAVFGLVFADAIALYWIARTGPKRLKARLEAGAQKDERVAKGLALLGRSGPLLISCGRFVPGVRFAVNVSMGLTEYPYRRFLLFSAIGGIGWSIYTCLLAYWISTALADFALASILISGIVTTVLVAGVYWIDRRRNASDEFAAAPELTALH